MDISHILLCKAQDGVSIAEFKPKYISLKVTERTEKAGNRVMELALYWGKYFGCTPSNFHINPVTGHFLKED